MHCSRSLCLLLARVCFLYKRSRFTPTQGLLLHCLIADWAAEDGICDVARMHVNGEEGPPAGGGDWRSLVRWKGSKEV